MRKQCVLGILMSIHLLGLESFGGAGGKEPVYQGKTLSEWTRALEDKNVLVRRQAALAMVNMGVQAKPAVHALVKALKDNPKDLTVIQSAVITLGLIGPDAREAVWALADLLENNQIFLRKQVFETLEKIGPAAVPSLIKTMGQANPQVVEGAIVILTRMSAREAIPSFREALKNPNASIRVTAARALWTRGEHYQEHFNLIFEALGEKDVAARQKAWSFFGSGQPTLVAPFPNSVALPSLPSAGAEVVPFLTRRLADNQDAVREQAVKALAYLGPVAEKAAPALSVALKDEVLLVRQCAAYTLAHLGPAAKTAIPQLTEALNDKVEIVREFAAQTLGDLGADAKDAVPALIRAMKDPAPAVQRSAIEALGRIGPGARDAIRAMVELLENEKDPMGNPKIQPNRPFFPRPSPQNPVPRTISDSNTVLVGRALLDIGGDAPQAVPIFVRKLKGKSEVERRMAAQVLPRLGKEAADSLVLCLKEPDPTVRSLSAFALGSLRVGPTLEMTRALGQALEDVDAETSQQAAFALARLGPQGAAALPQLQKTLTTAKDKELRGLAAQALGEIGPASAPAVDDLVKALQDEDPYVRQWAAFALGEIGPGASVAVPRLSELRKDSNAYVRRSATRAITKIRR